MANYTDESIKKRIEVLRRKRGVTASRFAKECGVDQGNFSRALNGKGGFSEVVLMKIAKATNVTFDWLLTGCGLCGADGEKAYEALNADFHGNGTLDETLKNIINSSMAIDDGKKHELWDALNRVLNGSASEERNSADLSIFTHFIGFSHSRGIQHLTFFINACAVNYTHFFCTVYAVGVATKTGKRSIYR